MSTVFYITLVSPYELANVIDEKSLPELGYLIASDVVAKRLKELWKDVQISSFDEAIEWEYEGEEGTISGSIRQNNISTMSQGSTSYMSEVVNIYRDIVPNKYTIYVFHLGQPDGIFLRDGKKVDKNSFDIF